MARLRLGLLAVLAALLLSGELQAAPARDELELSRLLVEQGRGLDEAGLALQDWSAGRLSQAQALGIVRKAHQGSLRVVATLQARARAAGRLGAAALGVASERAGVAEGTLRLVEAGSASREVLLDFSQRQSQVMGRSLESWLRARQVHGKELLGTSPAGRVADWYRWQEQLLPLQLQAAALGARARAALHAMASGSGAQTEGLTRSGEALAGKVGALAVPGWLRPAQDAAAREVRSLARLLEGVELMAGDPSPESHSRVRRWSASLQRDSAAAEDEALRALARALGN